MLVFCVLIIETEPLFSVCGLLEIVATALCIVGYVNVVSVCCDNNTALLCFA